MEKALDRGKYTDLSRKGSYRNGGKKTSPVIDRARINDSICIGTEIYFWNVKC